MDPVDVAEGGDFRVEEDDILNILEAFFQQLVSGIEEAFLPFRVIGIDAPVECRKEDQSGLPGSTGHI
ncbi:MAG: hypothetical protein ACD_75C02216G0001 [uncultured bacterium]|nr:MAG: hypothetical protein ACD_75C02216G0001 [uncultured bacterium]